MFSDVTSFAGGILPNYQSLILKGIRSTRIIPRPSPIQQIQGGVGLMRTKFTFPSPAEILPCVVLICNERHKNPIADALSRSSESDIKL